MKQTVSTTELRWDKALKDTDKDEALENDSFTEEQEREEYRKLFSCCSRFIAANPELIGEVRNALKFSARSMMSNRQEAVNQFQDIAGKLDAFLAQCECGEIDPKQFIVEEEKTDANSSSTTS